MVVILKVIVEVIQVIGIIGIALRMTTLIDRYKRNRKQSKDSSHELMLIFFYTLVLLYFTLFSYLSIL